MASRRQHRPVYSQLHFINTLLGLDGTSFSVEGFALNREGRYETFTFGRVMDQNGTPVLSTPDGFVEIEDAGLKAKLTQMPKLGFILPGEPQRVDDRLLYRGAPSLFFGLARFSGETVEALPPDDISTKTYAPVDMAYESFFSKPMTIPVGSEARVSHYERFWAEGALLLNSAGETSIFDAAYINQATDQASELPDEERLADLVQSAIFLTEA